MHRNTPQTNKKNIRSKEKKSLSETNPFLILNKSAMYNWQFSSTITPIYTYTFKNKINIK